CVGSLPAQDNSTLLNLLVRKGILTEQDADDLRADLAKENMAAMVSTGKSNNLERLSLAGRFQSQYVNLGTDTGGGAANPPTTRHFLLRRIYFGGKALFSSNWSATFNYDFANLSFDQGFISWAPDPWLVID